LEQLLMIRRSKLEKILAFCLVTLLSVSQGAFCGDDWPLTHSIHAPEAKQAAAADERFVWAVTNKRVALYDRVTGQKISESPESALHFNGAFLKEGRLYLAHSNHPETPARSDIQLFDSETASLDLFHDFCESDGYLNWAVYHDDAWWCFFAHYGEDNAKSYLAKFDSQWSELQRWRCPKSILSQLGRHSLSGGIWRGSELLVTGHDDPVLFRLSLPDCGDELNHVGTDTIPFTGQGFADDSATGGLVGIHRLNKRILFAAPPASRPLRVRVLSYNIRHGLGMDDDLNLERIARVIQSVNPDLVSLQELDSGTRRSDLVDQPAELAKLTGMHFVFGPNISFQGGKYGNAILSRWPIESHHNHPLPNIDSGEQRGLLDARIELPAGRDRLRLLATHLDHRRDPRERIASAAYIRELVAQSPDERVILAGDLNDRLESAVLTEFLQDFARPHEGELPTIPVSNPRRQIDFILYRPQVGWAPLETRVLPEPLASDHLPIFSVLELVP
jgi:endonuclease/exonuclease/phosphatase family metal-dependent hydrolase